MVKEEHQEVHDEEALTHRILTDAKDQLIKAGMDPIDIGNRFCEFGVGLITEDDDRFEDGNYMLDRICEQIRDVAQQWACHLSDQARRGEGEKNL